MTGESGPSRDVPSPEQMRIDPFAFSPRCRSMIRGLGGASPPLEPGYAFHSQYLNCPAGPIVFLLSFEGLQARQGTLTLKINSLLKREDTQAETIRTMQVPLRDIADRPRPVAIRINCSGRHEYSISGYIHDRTDAAARELSIALERRSDVARFMDGLRQKSRALLSSPTPRLAPALTSDSPPSLRDPVSQPFTRAQCEEPAFARWCREMDVAPAVDPLLWGRAYILQCLERYGILKPGAVGIGFGGDEALSDPIPGLLEAAGCRILMTGRSLPDTAGPEGAEPDGRFLALEMTQIPAELNDFDFSWSIRATDQLPSVIAATQFLEDSLDCLKPQGIGVHCIAFDAASERSGNVETSPIFTRDDLNRLATRLMARGHSIGQFKYPQQKESVSLFGIVMRSGGPSQDTQRGAGAHG